MIKVLIFGCGYHGRAAFRRCIRTNSKFKVEAWIDNDKKKIGKKLFNVNIYNPKNIESLDFDRIILCGRNIKSQFKQIPKKFKNKIIYWGRSKIQPSNFQKKKRELKTKEILKKIINILDKNEVNYWIDRSGLLSLIRDKKFSLLSDFDISFNKVDIKKIFKIFKKKRSFNIFKGFIKRKNKYYPQLYIKSKNNLLSFEHATIDFTFYDFKKDFIYQYDNKKKRIPKKLINDFIVFKSQNINFKIPKFYKEYLKYLYGPNYLQKIEFWENTLRIKNRILISKKL